MKPPSLLLVATAAAVVQANPPSHPDPLAARSLDAVLHRPGFIPVFFDAFTGPPGSPPSPSNWLYDIGTQYVDGAPHWGNNEAEHYTDALENAHVTPRQTLAIIPRRHPTTGIWTSARLETRRVFAAPPPGARLLVEARLRLGAAPPSRQQGIWPAFWALGAAFRANHTDWPGASEWDILESVNGGATMFATAHCGVAPDGPCNEYNGLGNGGVGFGRGVFHTVGFVVDRSMCGEGEGVDATKTWRDEKLEWLLDGAKVFELAGATVGDEEAWKQLAHRGHFLLLNVAVGGNWPGLPNNQTLDGPDVGMEFDYVGVWASVE
jgi:hypothetical protein